MSEWVRKPKYKDIKNKKRNRNKSLYFPRPMEKIDVDIENHTPNVGNSDDLVQERGVTKSLHEHTGKMNKIKKAKKKHCIIEWPTEYYLNKYTQEKECQAEREGAMHSKQQTRNIKCVNSEKLKNRAKYDKDKNFHVLSHKNLLKDYLKKVESGLMKPEELDKILNQRPVLPESEESVKTESADNDYLEPEHFEQKSFPLEEGVYDRSTSSDDDDDTYYNLLIKDLDVKGLR